MVLTEALRVKTIKDLNVKGFAYCWKLLKPRSVQISMLIRFNVCSVADIVVGTAEALVLCSLWSLQGTFETINVILTLNH